MASLMLDLPKAELVGAPTVGSFITLDANEFISMLVNNTLIRNDTAYKLTGTENTLYPEMFDCKAVTFYDTELVSLKGNLQYCMFFNCRFLGNEMMANFDNSFFQDCELNDCRFRDCSFENTVFSNVNLRNSKFNRCYLRGANLDDVDFTGATMNQIDMRDVELEGKNIIGLVVGSNKVYNKPYPTVYAGSDLINSGNPDAFFNPGAELYVNEDEYEDEPVVGFDPVFTTEPEESKLIFTETEMEKIVIDGSTKGIDVMMGDNEPSTIINEFIKDEDNVNNSVVINVVDKQLDGSPKSTVYLYNKDNLNQLLQTTIVYPCKEANNVLKSVIESMPLYSFGPLIVRRFNVSKETIDNILSTSGNVYFNIFKTSTTYPSIASKGVVDGVSTWVGNSHCSAGFGAEQIWTAKQVIGLTGGKKHRKTHKHASRKHKSRKHKTHKSRKHTSRKHKTHKLRKHKTHKLSKHN